MFPRIVCGISGASPAEARRILAELQEEYQAEVAQAMDMTFMDGTRVSYPFRGSATHQIGRPESIPSGGNGVI